MGKSFQSAYGISIPKSATFTATVAENADVYVCTAATVPIVATLFSPAGKYFQTIRVVNSASSVNIVIVASASGGSIVGNTILLPGQSAVLQSDGISQWFNFEPAALASVSKAIGSANILALRATPVSLIPSPGSGYLILPPTFLFTMVRSSTAYANGGALEMRYTDGSGAKVSADIAASVVTTGGAGTEYNSVGGIVSSITPVPAAPIVLTCASAEFITGTGTATMRMTYRVVPAP